MVKSNAAKVHPMRAAKIATVFMITSFCASAHNEFVKTHPTLGTYIPGDPCNFQRLQKNDLTRGEVYIIYGVDLLINDALNLRSECAIFSALPDCNLVLLDAWERHSMEILDSLSHCIMLFHLDSLIENRDIALRYRSYGMHLKCPHCTRVFAILLVTLRWRADRCPRWRHGKKEIICCAHHRIGYKLILFSSYFDTETFFVSLRVVRPMVKWRQTAD